VLRYGSPDPAPLVASTGDAHLEAAGRLRMLATWYVLAMLGTGCIVYFFVRLFSFRQDSFLWLLGAYAVLVSLGVGVVLFNNGQARAENGLGAQTICAAFGGPARESHVSANDSRRAGKEIGAVPGEPDLTCPGNAKYASMWELNGVQRYFILFVMPALALSGISALASNGAPRQQAAHLRTCLYLSAALLVCGLMFLSALLRWPAAALRGEAAAAYLSHVDAYLLYWGASYSVLIAAYYVPVAARLSAEIGAALAVAGREAPDGSDARLLDAVDILKVAAAVFAPVITALIGNVAAI